MYALFTRLQAQSSSSVLQQVEAVQASSAKERIAAFGHFVVATSEARVREEQDSMHHQRGARPLPRPQSVRSLPGELMGEDLTKA